MSRKDYTPSHLRDGFDESKVEVIDQVEAPPPTSTVGARSGDGANTGISPASIAGTSAAISKHRKNKRKSGKYQKRLRRKVRFQEVLEGVEITIANEARKRQ